MPLNELDSELALSDDDEPVSKLELSADDSDDYDEGVIVFEKVG